MPLFSQALTIYANHRVLIQLVYIPSLLSRPSAFIRKVYTAWSVSPYDKRFPQVTSYSCPVWKIIVVSVWVYVYMYVYKRNTQWGAEQSSPLNLSSAQVANFQNEAGYRNRVKILGGSDAG